MDPFGLCHDVEGHFKQCLCWFSVPFEKCYIFPTKSGLPPTKNGGTVEGLVLIGLQNRLCGPLLFSKNSIIFT